MIYLIIYQLLMMLLAYIAEFVLWFNYGFMFLTAKPNLHITIY